jgi:hypothetical protein
LDDQDTYEVETYKGKPMIEFPVQAKLPGLKDPFKGRIDLVVEDQEYGGLWLWDAKWVKTVPAPDERMMSPQAVMYVWALRTFYGLDVRGFVYNYGRTKPPTIPRVLKRPEGMLSTAQKMDTDFYTYLQAIKDNHGKEWKRYLDYYRPKLKALKGREALWFRRPEPEAAPRSYFYNCKFNCDYHELCVAEFTGLNIDPLIKNNYEIVGERYGERVEDLLNA